MSSFAQNGTFLDKAVLNFVPLMSPKISYQNDFKFVGTYKQIKYTPTLTTRLIKCDFVFYTLGEVIKFEEFFNEHLGSFKSFFIPNFNSYFEITLHNLADNYFIAKNTKKELINDHFGKFIIINAPSGEIYTQITNVHSNHYEYSNRPYPTGRDYIYFEADLSEQVLPNTKIKELIKVRFNNDFLSIKHSNAAKFSVSCEFKEVIND